MGNLRQATTAIVGGAIGFAIGGAAGAFRGFQAGLLAGGVLFPNELPGQEGPRLEDVERLAADPGEPIATVYGTGTVSGFRLYLCETLTEVGSTEEVGGKGGGGQEVTTYEYFQTLALGLCRGPITGVGRIWENGELVYDPRAQLDGESAGDYAARVAMSDEYAETFTLYLGSETQEADPTLESELGAGNVPGYRGLAYIVFPDRALREDQARRHPAFKIEVTSAAGDVTLATIAADVCAEAGLDAAEYDVTALAAASIRGYVVGRLAPGRSILEPLRMVGQFDYVESNGQIIFRVRGEVPVATLTSADLGAHLAVGGQVPPAVTTEKLQDVELPRQIRVRYSSYARDYERGEQLSPARHGTVGVNDVSIDLPLVLDDAQAAQVAEVMFREAWASRYSHEFALDQSFHRLEPADALLLPVDGRNYRVRVTSIDDSQLIVRRVQALRDDDGAYVSTAIATEPVRPASQVTLLGATELELLDLPALRDADDDPGVYAACWRSGTGQTWNGARLHRSVDAGVTWTEIATVANQAIVGTLVSAPASGDPATWDAAQYFDVDIVTDDATFSSRTDDAVIAGANLLAIGAHGRWHLVQFAAAELVSEGRYRLSRLLLGRRGTEHLIGTEQVGDRVVLVSGAGIFRVPVQTSQIGASLLYRAVTAGASFGSGSDESFTSAGQALETFSPVWIRGERDGSENLTITWLRRDRLSATLRDGVALPLNEASEAYEVDVLSGPGGSVVRTISGLSSEAAAYSAANQVTDFGSAQAAVTVRVYQLSGEVGRGQYAEATI